MRAKTSESENATQQKARSSAPALQNTDIISAMARWDAEKESEYG